jgi:four helix bundle protein
MRARSYKELEVWQKAMDLVVACYEVTHLFPAPEKFGLASQLRRAAVSVCANIAEGQGRGSSNEFVRFLLIARGSVAELETHITLGSRLRYIAAEDGDRLMAGAGDVARMLNGLLRSLRNRSQ